MQSLFNIGEEVVCVDDSSNMGVKPPIKEGKHYIVKGIVNCKYGMFGVDIGIVSDETRYICMQCHSITHSNVWPFRQTRFVPLSHEENVNELVEEINQVNA